MSETSPLPGFEPMESPRPGSSPEGSRARTSASRARVPAWTVSAPDSGERFAVSLASFDPSACSWRTSGLFVAEDSSQFSQTLPRSGMTRSGTLYLLPPLVLLTSVIASGSSPRDALLPTPLASDCEQAGGIKAYMDGVRGLSLTTWARIETHAPLLPTPQAQDHRNCADYSDGSRGHSPQLRHLGKGRLNPRFVEWMMGYPPGWTDLEGLDT